MTTKSKALSKGYGYVDESNVVHKIDPKFLSTSINLEIPADKVASILELLEEDGEMGAETLTSVILDGETKTIDADVCETIKTFAKANTIVFNFKDADGNGAAFAQCAYDVKFTVAGGLEATAYFACDEMPYKLALILDETANTLVVAAIAKGEGESEEAVTITLTGADWNEFANHLFNGGRPITELMINDSTMTLNPFIFSKLVDAAEKGLLEVATFSGYSKPLEVDDSFIKFDFSVAPIDRRNLIHCDILMAGDGFICTMDFDCGEALPFGLSEEDMAYFDNLDYIGEKEITTIFEDFANGGESDIDEGILALLRKAIVNNALDFTLNPDTSGHGTVTQHQYILHDGTHIAFIDATIEFPSIDRAVDLIFDWDDMDSITVKMRKLSQSAESSDYVFYAAKGTGGVAKYYKSYNDAISGGTEVTPDWAAIRTDILKNNANAKIKLLIEEKDSGDDVFTVVRTYDCVGVRTADGMLEFRCIEFEGDTGMV